MKKIIVFSTLVLAFILSTLIITRVNAEPKLSPSQKQEILEVLGQIRSHKEEIEEAKKRMEDLYKGEDEAFNNNSWVIELQKEGEDILASSVGQRLGRKMRGWDKSDKTKPVTEFLDKEETEALKRMNQIGDELGEMRDDKLDGRRLIIRNAEHTIVIQEEKLKKLEDEYGKAAIAAVKGGSVGEKEVKEAAKVSKPGEKISDSTLKTIVYATAKQLGWDKNEDYEMNYLDPAGYGGRFNAHTIQLGGSVGRIGVSYSKYATSKKFAENYCKAQAKDDYIAKVIEVGPEGKRYNACYFYRNGSSKINNTSIHLMIDKYRLFFDSDDLYWLRTDPIAAINALIGNFLVSY